ncbi:hypothetical protein LCGC14_2667830 [marine sediment metagenome]|uniref:TFIIB-type domain-containing protein n=1 Tax=marine sediment metagenome TaxID=412755 RepID=A0A0F8ZQ39_9ZZZZ
MNNPCPRCGGTLLRDREDERACLNCGCVLYARAPDQTPPGRGETEFNNKFVARRRRK